MFWTLNLVWILCLFEYLLLQEVLIQLIKSSLSFDEMLLMSCFRVVACKEILEFWFELICSYCFKLLFVLIANITSSS